MEALLTLNLFALSLPAALLGTALFGGLLSLPLWRRPGTTGPDSRPCG